MLLLASLTTSCAGTPPQREMDLPYITLDDLDVTQLLPPPPAPGSRLQEQDVSAVRLAHDRSSPEEMQRAEANVPVSVFRFADVLGSGFAPERLPVTARFFARINRDLGPFLSMTKECWRRPRPFVVDASIVPTNLFIASTTERPRGAAASTEPVHLGPACVHVEHADTERKISYSYPSGHATVGAIAAIVLAELVPERRAELFARGWEYGAARIVGGVHFPTDVESGRLLAASLVVVMLKNERFRHDMESARVELRAALGLG